MLLAEANRMKMYGDGKHRWQSRTTIVSALDVPAELGTGRSECGNAKLGAVCVFTCPLLRVPPHPRHQLLCANKPQKRAHCQCRGLRGSHAKEHLVWEALVAQSCRARARRGREGRCGAHSSPPGGTAEECSFCPRWRQAVTEAPEEDLFP